MACFVEFEPETQCPQATHLWKAPVLQNTVHKTRFTCDTQGSSSTSVGGFTPAGSTVVTHSLQPFRTNHESSPRDRRIHTPPNTTQQLPSIVKVHQGASRCIKAFRAEVILNFLLKYSIRVWLWFFHHLYFRH